MTMQTYWDLSEADRAALTRDDVARFVDLELMQKGVLKPKPLELLDVTPVELATETYFQIEGLGSYGEHATIGELGFRTESEARAVIEMRPVVVRQEWDLGKTLFARQISPNSSIKLVTLAAENSVLAQRARLKEITAANTENDKRKRAFEEQTKKVDETLRGLWDDWHACVAKAAEMRRVAEVFADYKRMAGGDEAVAKRFLARAFPQSTVTDAQEWTGVSMRLPATDGGVQQAAAASGDEARDRAADDNEIF